MSYPESMVVTTVQVTKYPKPGQRHCGDAPEYYVSVPRHGAIGYSPDVLRLTARAGNETVLGLLRAFPLADANGVIGEYLTGGHRLEAQPLDADELIRAAVDTARFADMLLSPEGRHRLREAMGGTLGLAPIPALSGGLR
ncbi:hypothetical protein [Embleya sp. NBC_00896]|uniref:hypothetical protein n=1 Tax=Embleya sp. NBC_00896 TaxID=2975961 RepID=UPI002F91B8BB|nr:hypothetical protein OG928_47800 [Embleya sp. NBC_00896]